MFDNHQKRIAAYAKRGPDEFARTMTFVYATIQQSLDTVPGAMKDIDREGIESKFLWGFKREAYEWLQANKLAVYNDAMELSFTADDDRAERELLQYFGALPGLGLVKAGFVLQLAFGLGGCIDGHNVRRFGVLEGRKALPIYMRAWHYKKASPIKRAEYVTAYQSLLKRAGGCEALWDDWCIYLRSRAPAKYHSADYVSELHCIALGV